MVVARWMSVDETATALGVSSRTLQNMANRRELKRRRVGRRSEYLVEVVGAEDAAESETAAAAMAAGASLVRLGTRLGELEARLGGLEKRGRATQPRDLPPRHHRRPL